MKTTNSILQVLDYVKTLSDEVLDKLIKEVHCLQKDCFLILKLQLPGRAQGVL